MDTIPHEGKDIYVESFVITIIIIIISIIIIIIIITILVTASISSKAVDIGKIIMMQTN